MNRRRSRRAGITRIDLTVALGLLLASLGLLLPACNRAVTTQKQTESVNNLKNLGEGAHKMFDQMADVNPIRVAAARAQSTNNLKQMGLAILNVAGRFDGLLPPATGTFPATTVRNNSPNTTIFYHMLPYIEHDAIFQKYKQDPTSTPKTETIKTFCAPSDPSNPGVNTALCSYAANVAVFGTFNGGTARYPALFNAKGTSNSILFFEHYASPTIDGKTVSNYWYSPSTTLYAGVWKPGDPNSWQAIKNPQFNVPHDGTDPSPDNATAQGFITDTIVVGLADGSARILKLAVTKTQKFTFEGKQFDASAWQWACCVSGVLGNSPAPATGW